MFVRRYVEIAVRIATSSNEYKLGLRARIKKASRVLFQQQGAVSAWQDVLLRLADKEALPPSRHDASAQERSVGTVGAVSTGGTGAEDSW